MIRRKKKIQDEKCTQAILFARVSSKKQKDKGVSLDVQEANAGMQNEILTILLKDCSLNGKTLSYNLRSPFDKLLVSQLSDWKDIIINNIKDLDAIEYNIKALNLVERK